MLLMENVSEKSEEEIENDSLGHNSQLSRLVMKNSRVPSSVQLCVLASKDKRCVCCALEQPT